MPQLDIMKIIKTASDSKASDVHIGENAKPKFRIDSQLKDSEFGVVDKPTIEKFLKQIKIKQREF